MVGDSLASDMNAVAATAERGCGASRGAGGLGLALAIVATLLVAVLLVGGWARCRHLSDRSIWFDESVSWRLTEFPWSEMLRRVAADTHAPLYFFVLKLWSAIFGSSLASLRGLSVAASAVTLLGMYLFARDAFGRTDGRSEPDGLAEARGRWIGLVTAALLCVSVYQTQLACEMRMYSLGMALVAWSSWLLVRALRSARLGPWLLFGAVDLAFAYTHYFALFSIVTQAVYLTMYAVLQWRRDARGALATVRGSAAALAVLVIGWLPWLPTFLKQRAAVGEGWWMPPFHFADIRGVCQELLLGPAGEVFPLVDRYAGLCCAVYVAVLVVLAWRSTAGHWYLLAMAVGPPVMCVAVSATGSNILLGRYLAYSQVFWAVALATLLWRIPSSVAKSGLAYGLVMSAAAYQVAFVEQLDIPRKPGMQAAVAFIEARRKSGEPVIACSTLLYFPAQYHASDRTDWHVYRSAGDIPHFAGAPVLVPGDVIVRRQLDEIGAGRVWVIDTTGRWAASDMPVPATWRMDELAWFREVYSFQHDVVVKQYRIEQDPVADQQTGSIANASRRTPAEDEAAKTGAQQ